MYNNFLFCASVLYLLVNTGCVEQKTPVKNESNITANKLGDTLKFEIKTTVIADSFFRKYFNAASYTNLEVSDNSFVLADRIIYSKNRIYIYDSRKVIVYVYNESGELLTILNSGGDEFENIADLGVDKNKTIYILDGKNEAIVCYDSSFVFKYKKALTYETDILSPLNNGTFLFSLSSWNHLNYRQDKLLLVDSAFSHLKTLLRYNKYVDNNYWLSSYRFIKADNRIYYNRPIDNTVYILSEEGGIVQSCYFDFGKMNVPDEDKKDVEANLPKYTNYRLITDFAFVNKDFALGKIWDKKENVFFYFDRKKNEIFLENPQNSSILKYIGDFDGETLISIIYPGEYNEKNYGYLPQEQKEWLQKGGYVICKLEVKEVIQSAHN